jgi:hypothetical protein
VNIFYVDKDAAIAAQCLVNRHVVKMIVESFQLLSTAHRLLDGEQYAGKSKTGRNAKRWRLPDARDSVIYTATHINHPSAVWCRESVENYNWLVDHTFALMEEYTYRYGKIHKCSGELSYMLQSPPMNLKNWDWTDPPSAMADEYKISNDALTNYRHYYKVGKAHLHNYTKRQPPEWLME